MGELLQRAVAMSINGNGTQLSNAEYHALPGVSHSMLKDSGDPRVYQYKYLSGKYRPESKPHFDFGSAVHDLCLLGSDAGITRIPDAALSKSGARSGRAWEAFAAEHSGGILLKQHEYDAAQRCVDAIQQDEAARYFLGKPGVAEHAFRYADDLLELLLRCKVDRLVESADGIVAVDLKTSSGSRASQFVRQVVNYSYHTQEAFYRRVLRACGVDIVEFVFIAVSVDPPHTVDCYSLNEEFRRMGEIEVENRLIALADRIRANNWRSDTSGSVIQLAPPNYLKYAGEYDV